MEKMSGFTQMLGESLIAKDGTKAKTEDLPKQPDSSVVGLYFSAHWCPPCRQFTPVLETLYNKFKSKHPEKKFEVVFVSSDKDEKSFNEYYKDMPWLALPFNEREKKKELSKKYKVNGIPTLVFLEGDSGKLITTDGRSCVTEDPEGSEFPWKPKLLSDILAGVLKTKTGETTADEALKGKVLGIYFSAHWCPPCRGFTPRLADTYKKLQAANKNFEVVYVSADRTEEAFKEYFAEMPWLAIPYSAEKRRKQLNNHFKVQGIPSLIILDENHAIIQKNGRGAVTKDTEGKNFPWEPAPLNVMNDEYTGCINEGITVIYFTDGDKDQIAKAKDIMAPLAQEYVKEYKENQKQSSLPAPDGQAASNLSAKLLEEVFFLYEDDGCDEVAEAVSSYFKLTQRSPLLVVLDIMESRKYEMPEGPITKDAVENMMQKLKDRKLEYTPLSRQH